MKEVVFVTDKRYPHGMANSRRLHLMAKGLQAHGILAQIAVVYPSEFGETVNRQRSGMYDGVRFSNYCPTPVQYEGCPKVFHDRVWIKIKRRVLKFIGFLHFIGRLVVSRRSKVVISLAMRDSLRLAILWWICKVTGRFFLQEIAECPGYEKATPDEDGGLVIGRKGLGALKYCDGFVVITEEIGRLVSKMGTKRVIIQVPILCDFAEFSEPTVRRNLGKYFAYAGAFDDNKDGFETMIAAFSRFIRKYPQCCDMRLVCTGELASAKKRRYVEDRLRHYGVTGNVDLTGYVERDKYIQILCDAIGLLLMKPKNIQNDYNFPFKVGEYLASGRPVIHTDTGIVRKSMEDQENIILIPPSDVDAAARRLADLIKFPERANQIGRAGKKFAIRNFDYRYGTRHLSEFINRIM